MAGRLITVLAVCLIVVGLLGLWRNWLSVSVEEPEPDRSEMRITVDKEKIREDMDRVAQNARGVRDSLEDTIRARTLEGVVVDVEPAEERLNVDTPDQGMVTVVVDASTTLRVAGEAVELERLPRGAAVKVTYRQHDEQRVATRIETVDE